MGRDCSSSVVVWLSSSSVVVMDTKDTTTDDYTDGKPPPPPATKADPCVPRPPGAAPGCVLGQARPGWAEVGRVRQRDVVADGGLHRLSVDESVQIGGRVNSCSIP